MHLMNMNVGIGPSTCNRAQCQHSLVCYILHLVLLWFQNFYCRLLLVGYDRK